MAKPPTSVRSIRLPNDLWIMLQAQADSLGISLNRYVAMRLEGARQDARQGSKIVAAARIKVERISTLAELERWPSGALVEPHRTEDPASKLTAGSTVTFGRPDAKPGSRLKVKKP